MIELYQAIILSIIQGITEWLPMSSSGHLAIVQSIFGFQNLPYDVFLHFASIFAVIVIYRKSIWKLLKVKKKDDWRYFFKILIAMIPAAIVGLFFKDFIASTFSSTLFLGIFFIMGGGIIYMTKYFKDKKRKITYMDSIFIGIVQMISLFPGISRSGMTISAGVFRTIKRKEAIKFSFLMAIPLVFGASIIEAKDLIMSDINWSLLVLSFLITFIVSLFSIKFLLAVVRKKGFHYFGLYDFLIGVSLLILHFFL